MNNRANNFNQTGIMVTQKGLSKAMNAKIIGSGEETIVLAHGYGGDQSVWDNVLGQLAENCKVVVFDWSFAGAIKDPNFFDEGKYSSYADFADDLVSLMDEMRLSSTIFVGHSMSGMIGCIASVKRPELFKRLVLVASSPRYKNSEDYEGGFEESEIEQIFSSIEFNFEHWSSSFAAMIVGPKDPLATANFEKCLKKMAPNRALQVAKIVFLCDERNTLEEVTTPCTIIQCKNDVPVPNSVPKFMQNKIKADTNIEIIDMEGHFPQLTACNEFLDILNKAISQSL